MADRMFCIIRQGRSCHIDCGMATSNIMPSGMRQPQWTPHSPLSLADICMQVSGPATEERASQILNGREFQLGYPLHPHAPTGRDSAEASLDAVRGCCAATGIGQHLPLAMQSVGRSRVGRHVRILEASNPGSFVDGYLDSASIMMTWVV
jgi:hypothetical protein